MKRWLKIGLVLTALVCAAVCVVWFVHLQSERAAARQRELRYESDLHSYAGVIVPGMSRDPVEHYLRIHRVHFQRVYNFDGNGTDADLTKIGQEPAPWYCSEQNVYISFQFRSADGFESVDPSDKLQKITIYRWLQDCL